MLYPRLIRIPDKGLCTPTALLGFNACRVGLRLSITRAVNTAFAKGPVKFCLVVAVYFRIYVWPELKHRILPSVHTALHKLRRS